MRRLLVWSWLAVLSLSVVSRADAALKAETLTALKAATVYVQVDFYSPGNGPVTSTASGFLIKAEGETGYVLTNRHTVTPPAQHFLAAPPLVVFASGTKEEKTARAEVIITDPVRDLAILRVTGCKGLPKPLDPAVVAMPAETMSVFSLGFPLGEALAPARTRPTVSVTKSDVSNVRRNERDEVAAVQLDRELQKGHSGGPVVDAQGKLVGVVLGKLREAPITLVLGAPEIQRMLHGRVAAAGIGPLRVAAGQAELQATVDLIDPLRQVRNLAVHYVRADTLKEKPQPDKDGIWSLLPQTQRLDLSVNHHQKARRTFPLEAKDARAVTYLMQTTYVNGDGQSVVTPPGAFVVDFGRAADYTRPPQLPAQRPDVDLRGPGRKAGAQTVTELKLDSRHTLRCLTWSADGQAFFTLDEAGVLRRIAAATLREEARLEIGRQCSWLSLSAAGLLVTVRELQQVWLVDAQTLQVKQFVVVPQAERAVSAPTLEVGFVVGAGDVLSVWDLKSGAIQREVRLGADGRTVGYLLPTVTADGKYLLAHGGDGQLHRWQVQGNELKYEASSPRLTASKAAAVELGEGLVCLPGAAVAGPAPAGATALFAVGDLAKPSRTLATAEATLAVGLDTRSGQSYGHRGSTLLGFTLQGEQRHADDLGAGPIKQLLPHPKDKVLLVLTAAKLLRIELP
ncbi:MAG: trypsin-like peptidase domain-containing protein [Planctomycetia bacterium]|nr:trypsin-like peptidase domain-containing protein [Planctomycetia bacterium]